MISFSLEDLRGGRRIDGKLAQLQVGTVTLVDKSGKKLGYPSGMSMTGNSELMEGAEKGPFAYTIIITPSDKIKPADKQHFRVAIPLEKVELSPRGNGSGNSSVAVEPVGEPFVFEFTAPVSSVPITGMNQEVVANGVTLTLKRVEDSPGRPRAVICFKPPSDKRSWQPSFWDSPPLGVSEIGDGCWAVTMSDPIDGYYSLTVDELVGFKEPASQTVDSGKPLKADTKTIPGPWRFDFKVPKQ